MNIDKELVTTYRETEIRYDERHDKWTFNIRGRDRSAETLTNAKNAIDAPPPKEEKPFRRFEAWHRDYMGTHRVTVTSITETGRFWVTGENRGRKERSQAGNHELYPCDPENNAIVERLEAKQAEMDKHREEFVAIMKELRPVEPKDWEAKE